MKSYFIDKFYSPNLPYKFFNELNKFANTSMDVSDGLVSDLCKLINEQKLSFEINIDKIPISKNLEYFLIVDIAQPQANGRFREFHLEALAYDVLPGNRLQ